MPPPELVLTATLASCVALRGRVPAVAWQIVNRRSIAGYQLLLLLLIALPAWTAYQHRGPLRAADVALACVFVARLVGEFVADQQQSAYAGYQRRVSRIIPLPPRA